MCQVRTIAIWLLVVAVGAAVGCDGDQATPQGAVAPGAAVSPPPPPAAQGAVNGAAAHEVQSPNEEAPTARTTKSLAVQLSTGISLAQTGVDGTLMSFSVDYEFPAAAPTDAEFALVIERRDGQTVLHQQKLGTADNLTVLVPGWRPEDGPFYGYIVELDTLGRPVARSDRIELTAP